MHQPGLDSPKGPKRRNSLRTRTAALGALAVLAAATGAVVSAAPATAALHTPSAGSTHGQAVGAAFALTNAASGDAVLSWERDADGRLTHLQSYPTTGRGSGSGLGSQGALTLTPDRRYLLAVDAGSDQVTAFAVRGAALRRLDTVASGGHQPISVTAHGHLVYVLNAAGMRTPLPTVRGFRLTAAGLRPLRAAARTVAAGGAGPAQVSFSPSGKALVVTLKESNRIDVFPLSRSGRPAAPVSTASLGTTPFGFAFDALGHLVVSNAEGKAPGLATVTDYRLRRDGTVTPLSGPVALGQTAACWTVVSPDGRHAYTTNTGSGTVSSLVLGRHGQLALANPVAGRTGGAPADAAFTRHGGLLYVLDGGAHRIFGFATDPATGALTSAGSTPSLPASTVGLAAF